MTNLSNQIVRRASAVRRTLKPTVLRTAAYLCVVLRALLLAARGFCELGRCCRLRVAGDRAVIKLSRFVFEALRKWVHCHIARRPIPPTERLKEIPEAVSAIVMKLLAKNAELHCKPERAQPLARLLQEKTGGNPFFAIQFLSALSRGGAARVCPGARTGAVTPAVARIVRALVSAGSVERGGTGHHRDLAHSAGLRECETGR